ncbi:hypothetical protein SKAU_G00413160 [Synaphobranchus kaupii]|uniref:Uncharacterized protein n=1 Tax=Synaphobranchus kaupii TaxID=118154 RepID=A0A9Q1E8B7_SYNKA|nr:hypothetical protein SKAU_G00413160 [Synaphobranchus kaupii]
MWCNLRDSYVRNKRDIQGRSGRGQQEKEVEIYGSNVFLEIFHDKEKEGGAAGRTAQEAGGDGCIALEAGGDGCIALEAGSDGYIALEAGGDGCIALEAGDE